MKTGKYLFLWEGPRPMLFRPLAQDVPASATLEVRTEGSPDDAANEVRRVIQGSDPDVPLSGVRSMTSHLELGNAFIVFRMAATLSVFFGLMGLLLASIGLYGAHAVAGRQPVRSAPARRRGPVPRRGLLARLIRARATRDRDGSVGSVTRGLVAAS